MTDLETHDDGLFTCFLPNTEAGRAAWRVLAADDGSGKVLTIHAASVIRQLRQAGYSVGRRKARAIDADAVLAEMEAMGMT